MNKLADLSSLIRDRWACPSCTSSRLEVLADHVQCGSCQTVYLIDSGIPLFIDKSNLLPTKSKYSCDLSIVILTLNEQRNISMLLRDLKQVLNKLKISHELIVVDGGSIDNTAALARAEGASVMVQREPGYGQALKEGFGASQGCYVLTMDADLSHPAEFIEVLWGARNDCDLAVASRYVPGAQFHSSFLRKILSQL
jgi:cellulose synthase/poly-beta-1,6-N-acetylglucosamine synthase-like glycosyltransferase